MKQAKTIEKTRTMLKCSYRNAVKHVQTEHVTNQASFPSHSTGIQNFSDFFSLNYLLSLPGPGI
jgi:hypothetical protein